METSHTQHGTLSVESKNIFTMLKQWLYADADIVIRELISNALDAIEKRVDIQKDAFIPEITVTLCADTNRLIIRDNGIGMTRSEIDTYINQIAFSGAREYLKNNASKSNSVIGHFGVGFYSAFMWADMVSIHSLSYVDGSTGIKWSCDSDMQYHMSDCKKNSIGTDVILELNPTLPYIKNPSLLYEIIKKYFVFARYPIYFDATGYAHVPVNTPTPAWKLPDDVLDVENLREFYKDFFDDVLDPIYHIRFQSPDIGLSGIFFFRNTRNGMAEIDGKVKIYSKGVYLGENIPQLIPKFATLQNGIIECDKLDLVASRSQIRNDENSMIPLIYESIIQELSISCNDIYMNKREFLSKNWNNLGVFFKYATLQDKTFGSVMLRKILFKDVYGKMNTIKDYLLSQPDMYKTTVFYASDSSAQIKYIELYKSCGLNLLLMEHVIDTAYIRTYESIHPNISFIRIDSYVESIFGNFSTDITKEGENFTLHLFEQSIGTRLDNINLQIVDLPYRDVSTLLLNHESARRLADMMDIYGMADPSDQASRNKVSQSTLLINLNNPLIEYLLQEKDIHVCNEIIQHMFDLALLSQGDLEPEDMAAFLSRSERLLIKCI